VSNRRRRSSDFPAPVLGTAASPLYHLADVEGWLQTDGRTAEICLLSLRLALAKRPVRPRDYRGARTLCHGLTTDVADTDVAMRCRRQEATCAALTGGIATAVQLFGAVLDDARRRYGEDDPQVVELRREIALLRLPPTDRRG
jgi:hypothetical protein